MGTIDEIVKVLDDKLLESGKLYLTLGQANSELVNEGLMSISDKSNNELKKLLEKKLIPNSSQTDTKPKQWRIHLSENSKKRQQNKTSKTISKKDNLNINVKNSVATCPSCGEKTKFAMHCKNCGTYVVIPNDTNSKTNTTPKTNELSISKKQRNWLIGIAVVLILWLIGSLSDDNSNSNSKVQNSEWDASVYQVKHYLKNYYLKDPNSYEGIEWSKVNEMKGSSEYKYWVRHKYRAKNSFGGYVIENKIFYLDVQGSVVGEKDVY